MELEPTDFSLKRMLQAQPHGVYAKPQDLFVYLRTMTDRFWSEMSQAVTLIFEWAQYLRVPDGLQDLKYQIWENFLCRLSLDARLITGKTPAESQGNEVLRILVETVETTLLSRLSVHQLVQQQQQQPQPPPPTPQILPPLDVPPLPTSLQAFYAQQQQQQHQQTAAAVDPKELATLQRSMHRMVLPAQGPGMPIKLRRTKEEVDYHPRRRTKPAKKPVRERPSHKGSRSRRTVSRSTRRNYDDDDEEEENEDEDDQDEEEEDDEADHDDAPNREAASA